MSYLPFEILEVIFSHLATEDLLQCQLTSKQWYAASVEKLYSEPCLNTVEKVYPYIVAIMNSYRLGGYLKRITIHKEMRDRFDLIKIISNYCPNVLEIKGVGTDINFWKDLRVVLMRGQLSRLEVLPDSDGRNLDDYFYSAFLIRANLKELTLQDESHYCGTDLVGSFRFGQLRMELDEFEELETIRLCYKTVHGLDYLDHMIEDCRKLKKMVLNLPPIQMVKEPAKEPVEKIRPRRDIQYLECNWRLIEDEEQIDYLIQKFPNLKEFYLTSLLDFSVIGESLLVTPVCPFDAVLKLIRFTVTVPTFNVNMEIGRNDVAKIWTELVELNDEYKDVIINYTEHDSFVGKVGLSFDNVKLMLTFPVFSSPYVLAHTQFFSEIGSQIRSIRLNDVMDATNTIMEYHILHNLCYGIGQVLSIIEACPSLQELALPRTKYRVPYAVISFDHTELKKLIFSNVSDEEETVPILGYFSRFATNLKCIQLEYKGFQNPKFKYPVVVNIPNASLDFVISTELPLHFKNNVRFQVFIKLTTNEGVKCYYGTSTNITSISQAAYAQHRARLGGFFYEITCQSLKELVFHSRYSENDNLKFVF
ncbi:hypothetical protein BD770DRAFT_398314 [Pilaira anomala]|nr:hypothetical protein BD770DRAFT_398314 [Pilaira anomala]